MTVSDEVFRNRWRDVLPLGLVETAVSATHRWLPRLTNRVEAPA